MNRAARTITLADPVLLEARAFERVGYGAAVAGACVGFFGVGHVWCAVLFLCRRLLNGGVDVVLVLVEFSVVGGRVGFLNYLWSQTSKLIVG